MLICVCSIAQYSFAVRLLFSVEKNELPSYQSYCEENTGLSCN